MARSSHATGWRRGFNALLHGNTRERGTIGTPNVRLDDTSTQTLSRTVSQNAFAMVSEEVPNLSRKERRKLAREAAKREFKGIRTAMQSAKAEAEMKAKAEDPATLVKPATVQQTQKFGRKVATI